MNEKLRTTAVIDAKQCEVGDLIELCLKKRPNNRFKVRVKRIDRRSQDDNPIIYLSTSPWQRAQGAPRVIGGGTEVVVVHRVQRKDWKDRIH